MSTKKRVSIMLDADLTEAIDQLRDKVIREMNDKGVYGKVAAPSHGYIVRRMLREKLGMSTNDESPYQP